MVGNKAVEFCILFVLLKLLTSRLGRAGFGEYNLAETALVLVASAFLAPFHEAYLRDFHGASRRGEARAAGVLMLRSYAAVTLGFAALAALLAGPIAQRFEIHAETAVAAGLVFLFDRWRFLGQTLLNIQRKRRAWALNNLAYQLVLVSFVYAALSLGPATAGKALLGYAAAAALFAVLGGIPMLLGILRTPTGTKSSLARLAFTFGVPFALLLVLQWLQDFSDRYLVELLVDRETVGVYVAAYQVCGIPFTLLVRAFHDLLTPMAYEAGRDLHDPTHLWAADRIVLSGVVMQILIGVLLLPLFAWFGQELVVLLTSDRFQVPAMTISALAAARFLQAIGQSFQPIFSVHHQLPRLLWLRCFGAVVTLMLCWPLTRHYGAFGAALGTSLAFAVYLVALVFSPIGCWRFVSAARREAAASEAAAPR